ncbi:L,D-transpeptidase family protein [Microbulbifer sp. TYP-18]|uniref:L,D-transpeptidase family protein n=1 Tax=Microbulbifer sp. TYP-18 TaxID=3230024 RepID=UPI0034C5DE7E
MQSRSSLLTRSSLVALLLLGGTSLMTPEAQGRDYRDPNNPPPYVREYYRQLNQQNARHGRAYRNPRGYRGHRYYRNSNNYGGRYNRSYRNPRHMQQGASRYTARSWWRHGAGGGAAHIRIDLSEQAAYFYKGGRLVGMSPVSTGMAGHRTPTGSFRVSEKKLNHRSNLYGHYVSRRGYVLRSNVDVRRHRRPPGSVFRGASMDYMMRINGAITMHAGYVPGYPASHGCIRLPWHMAQVFFANAPMGTKVSVVP